MMLRYCHLISVIAIIMGLATMLGGTATASGRLVTDLSEKDFSITTSFHGTELLLFGAVDGREGDDLIVVIKGPPVDLAHRRKANRAGIWINVETNIWKQAPSFYQILATRSLDQIVAREKLVKLGVGTGNIGLEMSSETKAVGLTRPEPKQFIKALQSNMDAKNLWPAETGQVSLSQNALFRARVVLPANIVSGTYDIRILQMRDGVAINEDRTNLVVNKGGLSADIYNLAHKHSALYGVLAIAFAVAAGWLAAMAFRRY